MWVASTATTKLTDKRTSLSDRRDKSKGSIEKSRANLDIRLCLVCHFHDELTLRLNHVMQNALINSGDAKSISPRCRLEKRQLR